MKGNGWCGRSVRGYAGFIVVPLVALASELRASVDVDALDVPGHRSSDLHMLKTLVIAAMTKPHHVE